MRRIILAIFGGIILLSTLLAMPPRPGLFDPTTGLSLTTGDRYPIFPANWGEPGPNKLKGYDYCETVAILMQFPDNLADTMRRPAPLFDSMLYSTGVYNNQPYRAGSLNDYFLENSYGTYRVLGSIVGNRWFMSSHNYSEYYDGNYMLTTGWRLARDNVRQVDSLVDFNDYDLNSDGHIDAMFLVHAGADGADDGNVNHLWSHAIPNFNYQTNDGVIIDGVTNVPEFSLVTEARETTMCCIAVMCHELGHLVGLPDLYDYTRNTWGIGYWGLMGYGAWGAGGNTPWSPSHMEVWSKVRAGFVDPIVITNDTYNLRIPDIETNPIAYKVWRNGADCDTCFYLENRQQKGFDTPLPGPGLLIWHIDPWYSAWHNRVDLEEDSTFHLDRGTGIRPDPHIYHQALGDTSDPLPGIWNRTAFDNYTLPNSRDRRGIPTNVSVRNIRQVGDTIICDITFSPVSMDNVPRITAKTALEVFPNPFAKYVTVEIESDIYNNSKPKSVKIYSVKGDLVYTKFLNSKKFIWNGKDQTGKQLPAGIYYIQVNIDKFTISNKLIIQR